MTNNVDSPDTTVVCCVHSELVQEVREPGGLSAQIAPAPTLQPAWHANLHAGSAYTGA